VVAERSLPAETLRSFISEHAGGALGAAVVERVRLFDIYAGKPIPPTHVSLAFAIDYRSRERTLTDAEVGEAFTGVQRRLKEQFGVEVRQ
jgi:phenylalanyl-tRNA synthetase beta chain